MTTAIPSKKNLRRDAAPPTSSFPFRHPGKIAAQRASLGLETYEKNALIDDIDPDDAPPTARPASL